MIKVIILASIAAASAAPLHAAPDTGISPHLTGVDEVQRVDPGKTLKLIKRIRDAGGARIAS
ncbi:MAG: hypothetical protein B7Z02_11445 [Rhodobacterales bacterium 32-67-9]|nr:MAG: hypothetical protein B7Z02_11445 [Rhodobacterales bacterium 32-67-9]